MKKILYLLLMLFVWTSCSKEDERVVPVDGQYIADLGNGSLDGVVLKNGNCTDVILYKNGKRFDCRTNQIVTKGKYPNYEYSTEQPTDMEGLYLHMQAHFNDRDVFRAHYSGGYGLVGIGGTNIEFKLDNSVLDANGDGILDSWQ